MTGTALDTAGPSDTLDAATPALELAARLSKTEFVPKDLRGRDEAIMAAILTGRELGIAPMQALRGIHIIEGRPTLAAEMIRALVLRAGHQIWPIETNAKTCTMAAIRAGTDREVHITWTIADAERANLARKQVWRNYPRQMLLARATVELARILFADVIAGLYAAEEFDELPLVPGDTPSADEPAPTTKRRRKPKTAQSTAAATASAPTDSAGPTQAAPPPLPGEPGYDTPAADDEDVVEAELVDETPRRDTTAVQRLVIHAQKTARLDDEGRHALASHVLRRNITTWNDLSDDELEIMRSVIDDLGDGRIELAYSPTGALEIRPTAGDPPPAETGPTDWKALAETSGWTAAQTLLEARTIAKDLGIKPPSALDKITDPDLAATLRSKLQDPPF